jgi:phosphatidylserine decarboxylase
VGISGIRLARGTPTWLALLWLAPVAVRRAPARLALLALAATATSFFRDPERKPAGPGLLAPADGRVTESQEVSDGRWRVSVYLNLADVHVTRAPCDATVLSRRHRAGTHRPAFHTSSHTNERLDWLLATPVGEVALTQFAGTLARRIVAHRRVGDTIRRGDRIGLIRFGSRVDVLLPAGMPPLVAVGQRVVGGVTELAALSTT